MNAVERGVALARTTILAVNDLPEKIRDAQPERIDFGANDPEDFVTLDEMERRYVQRVLESVGGNKSHAARILDVDRKTLFRKLKREEAQAASAAGSSEASGSEPAKD